jgi:hypothetical protein
MDDFDAEEWAEMQKMYITHTSKELVKIQEDIDNIAMDFLKTFGHNIKGSEVCMVLKKSLALGLRLKRQPRQMIGLK